MQRPVTSRYSIINKTDKSSAKSSILTIEDRPKIPPSKREGERVSAHDAQIQMYESKSRALKEKGNFQGVENTNVFNGNSSNVKKKVSMENKSERRTRTIQKYLENKKKLDFTKTTTVITNKNMTKTHIPEKNLKGNLIENYNFQENSTPSCIHVPLERNSGVRQIVETQITHLRIHPIQNNKTVDQSTEMIPKQLKDTEVGTDPGKKKVDVITEIEVEKKDCDVQTLSIIKSQFDSLDIPNITLSKENKINESNVAIDKVYCRSLPDLHEPATQITPQKRYKPFVTEKGTENTGIIISRATLTYTRKQKFDYNLIRNTKPSVSSTSSSPLAYPMNVVSVLKKETKKKDSDHKQEDKFIEKQNKSSSNIEQAEYQERYRPGNLCSEFVKPSEMIGTISLHNGLQSDYIFEQFQRELHFIDSFFESLQYLESCSMSNNTIIDSSVEHWVTKSGFDVKTPKYDSLFSKFESITNNDDDTETLASKSLCLLNLLIRDEQRRAKNLLFVIKMREDALKDFTKSQILWLENKKKHDNIDIPTLKKKQRGALLKLQHECGEMQRMRKALLALSEQRKVALMKTKKNIELKLKNNVSLDQIILGKKKLKRNSSDRPAVPLKCFDLCSSGCDESTRSRPRSDVLNSEPLIVDATAKSAEKSIQTGESLIGQVDRSTDTVVENFVTVDGGYLNILFSNISLPEIFSSGKEYEVNTEALKTILHSANHSHSVLTDSGDVDKFIDQVNNRDQDKSTSPSTARSLLDEVDQYYKGLSEDIESPRDLSHQQNLKKGPIEESADLPMEPPMIPVKCASIAASESGEILLYNSSDVYVDALSMTAKEDSAGEESLFDKETCTAEAVAAQAGPLPVPAGAVAASTSGLDASSHLPSKTTSAESFANTDTSASSPMIYQPSSMMTLSIPAQSEAEELRRQQLAIEREIKALEQQQNQLIVVREIPDKPPPPYVPPQATRAPKSTRKFVPDDIIEDKVHQVLSEDDTADNNDEPFHIFLQDFCRESIVKHTKERGDKPWDACNLLPQKPPVSHEQKVKKTSEELQEVLKKGTSPVVVSSKHSTGLLKMCHDPFKG